MQKTDLIIIIAIVVIIASGMFFFLNSHEDSIPAEQTESDSQRPTVTVSITEEGFTPSEVKIKKGETVEWVNWSQSQRWPASNLHPTHEIYSEFDPLKPIDPGKAWSFTFDKVGRWSYHDHLAPNKRGVVEVE